MQMDWGISVSAPIWSKEFTAACFKADCKLERKYSFTDLEGSELDWKDSLITYKKALHKVNTTYYLSLIEENKSNPRFLFSAVADSESKLCWTKYSFN